MQLHAGIFIIIIIIIILLFRRLYNNFTVADVPRWAHSWLVRVSELDVLVLTRRVARSVFERNKRVLHLAAFLLAER